MPISISRWGEGVVFWEGGLGGDQLRPGTASSPVVAWHERWRPVQWTTGVRGTPRRTGTATGPSSAHFHPSAITSVRARSKPPRRRFSEQTVAQPGCSGWSTNTVRLRTPPPPPDGIQRARLSDSSAAVPEPGHPTTRPFGQSPHSVRQHDGQFPTPMPPRPRHPQGRPETRAAMQRGLPVAPVPVAKRPQGIQVALSWLHCRLKSRHRAITGDGLTAWRPDRLGVRPIPRYLAHDFRTGKALGARFC